MSNSVDRIKLMDSNFHLSHFKQTSSKTAKVRTLIKTLLHKLRIIIHFIPEIK